MRTIKILYTIRLNQCCVTTMSILSPDDAQTDIYKKMNYKKVLIKLKNKNLQKIMDTNRSRSRSSEKILNTVTKTKFRLNTRNLFLTYP